MRTHPTLVWISGYSFYSCLSLYSLPQVSTLHRDIMRFFLTNSSSETQTSGCKVWLNADWSKPVWKFHYTALHWKEKKLLSPVWKELRTLYDLFWCLPDSANLIFACKSESPCSQTVLIFISQIIHVVWFRNKCFEKENSTVNLELLIEVLIQTFDWSDDS